MDILFYIVFPVATILISIVLQKIIKNPILVAIFIFAIYLIVAYTAYTSDFLINAVIYTILAFLAAFITKVVCYFLKRLGIIDDNNLEERIDELQEDINRLEENINQLNELIENLTGNSSCGCNRRINSNY